MDARYFRNLLLGYQHLVAVDPVADRDECGHDIQNVFQRFVVDDQRKPFVDADVRRERYFDVVPAFEIGDDVCERCVVEDQAGFEPAAIIPGVDLPDGDLSGAGVQR